MALKILEGVDLQRMGHESADYLHTIIEGLKLAFADREAYFGDPDFVQVPLAGLLDERYAAERRDAIDPQRAARDMPPAGDPWRFHPEPRGKNGPFPTLDPDRPQPERISHWESDTSYLCTVDEQATRSRQPLRMSLVGPRSFRAWVFPSRDGVRKRGSIRGIPPVCSRGSGRASPRTPRWFLKMESRLCPSVVPAAMRRCRGCCRCS